MVAPSGEDYRSRCGRTVEVVTVPAVSLPGYRGLDVARPGADLLPVLRRVDPDVVHLASPAVLGAQAVLAASRLGLPSVAVWQTDLSAFARRYHVGVSTRLVWKRLRRIHNAADLTLVPSSASAYQLRGQDIGPLALWQRGVDRDLFDPGRRDQGLRAELAPAGELLVGFVGRLAPEKRAHLLEPISTLPGVRLVVVGDGPRRRQLEKLMPAAVFTGQVTGTELGRTVASLDTLVHPGADETFADETFCQVVQEALWTGRDSPNLRSRRARPSPTARGPASPTSCSRTIAASSPPAAGGATPRPVAGPADPVRCDHTAVAGDAAAASTSSSTKRAAVAGRAAAASAASATNSTVIGSAHDPVSPNRAPNSSGPSPETT